jgi:hypothetical protein
MFQSNAARVRGSANEHKNFMAPIMDINLAVRRGATKNSPRLDGSSLEYYKTYWAFIKVRTGPSSRLV